MRLGAPAVARKVPDMIKPTCKALSSDVGFDPLVLGSQKCTWLVTGMGCVSRYWVSKGNLYVLFCVRMGGQQRFLGARLSLGFYYLVGWLEKKNYLKSQWALQYFFVHRKATLLHSLYLSWCSSDLRIRF